MPFSNYNPRFADEGQQDLGALGGVANAILQGYLAHQLFQGLRQQQNLRQKILLSIAGEGGTNPLTGAVASSTPVPQAPEVGPSMPSAALQPQPSGLASTPLPGAGGYDAMTDFTRRRNALFGAAQPVPFF